MYRSYSVNNMPEPVMHNAEKPPRPMPKEETKPQEVIAPEKKSEGILDNLKKDDIILLVVILVLLLDECDDKLLLAAIAFVFFSDMF